MLVSRRFISGLLLASLACIVQAADLNEPEITDYDRSHWSFRPLAETEPPPVEQAGWVRNPVDAFVLAKIEAEGLSPQPRADRLTLIRRMTYDLTGLPPTSAEIERFLNDDSPDAYEQLVERLLASPSYGERWTQHWLDLARFAETDGFEHDHVRPNAWKYRDWVIDALNADMSYDEFVRLQLAGDQVAPGDPQAAIATGFLLCGPDMPDINLQEERRHNFLNNMTGNAGAVLMGLQFGCAQCHNHKFDPISQADFYRLRAFFDSAVLFREQPIPAPEQRAAIEEFQAERAARWKRLQAEIDALEAAARERDGSGGALEDRLSDDEQRRYEKLKADLARVKKQKPPEPPMGRVIKESNKPTVSRLMIRGDFRRPGPVLEPGYLRVANLDGDPPPDTSPGSSRRAALAEWLMQPGHPLTTRVIVNRVWMHHFGRGIVDTPSDFGIMGDAPTHPELLDWLAVQLPRHGWSPKWLHRLLVTSATYRQISRPPADNPGAWQATVEADPENRLLARMARRRLEGEALRDAMLAAANRLNRESGGPGVRPPLEKELVKTLLRGQWVVSPDEADHRRRSIYLFSRRNLRYPIFEVFDKPDTNLSCPQRNRTTIAPQALMLLNSELSLNAAAGLAADLFHDEPEGRAARIRLCYLRTLGRPPSDEQLGLAEEFLERDAAAIRSSGRTTVVESARFPAEVDPAAAAALTDFCLAVFNLNEFIYID